ncbi:MAG: sigma-70 family RNA polymerase sigma factor [Lewinella sp.]|nr:sigma-70 family RNA polymerase sigma factor [Lewinella sp.]
MKREKPTDLEVNREVLQNLDLGIYQRIEEDHRKVILNQALEQLGKPCQEILLLFYYHHYPIESIQHALGFSSEGAVRVKKLRCLEQLKSILKQPL